MFIRKFPVISDYYHKDLRKLFVGVKKRCSVLSIPSF